MIQILFLCRYKRDFHKKVKETGAWDLLSFPDMIGKELIILEIVYRYMEEYPNTAFYVDNGYTLRKHHIDAIYNMLEPDVGWIYKSPDMYKKRMILVRTNR